MSHIINFLEKLWTIQGQTLKSHHRKLLTYTWGLEETNPKGFFYIKNKNECPGTNWYPPVTKTQIPPNGQTQNKDKGDKVQNTNANGQDKTKSPKTRKKRQTSPECHALTHEFTPGVFSKDEPTQKWNMEETKETNVFRLYFMKDGKNKTYVSATTNDNELESKGDCGGIIAANVENFRTFEGNTRKVIKVLLGFFVTTILKRWWDQTSKIPRLEKLAISLNSIMQEGKNLIYKKK